MMVFEEPFYEQKKTAVRNVKNLAGLDESQRVEALRLLKGAEDSDRIEQVLRMANSIAERNINAAMAASLPAT